MGSAADLLDTAFTALDIVGIPPLAPPLANSEIAQAELLFGNQFPSSYRRLLQRYGCLALGDVQILGLGVPISSEPSVIWALLCLRVFGTGAPAALIPIQRMPGRTFRCILAEDDADDGPVVDWHLGFPPSEQSLTPVSPGFAAYFAELATGLTQSVQQQRQESPEWFQAGLDRMIWHIKHPEFQWHHQEGGKLPRNNVWRPYRFCVQDVVLGLTVLQHNRNTNHLEVDVFLTAAIPEYEADSGARALTLLILSEAYKAGSTMHITFTEHVEGGRVPGELADLAATVGVTLEHVADGFLLPLEARSLYAALTGFSPEVQTVLEHLERTGELSTALVCYAIHHGVWDRSEVEAILLACPRPGSLLGGRAVAEQRHLYLNDVTSGRAAAVFGSLNRHLRYRSHNVGAAVVHLEDDQRDLDISIDGPSFRVSFRCDSESLAVPWLCSDTAADCPSIISPGLRFEVLIRPRPAAEMAFELSSDWQAAADGRQGGPVYVLVSRDFESLPADDRHRLLAERPPGVGLLVYPQYCAALDSDVAQRIRSSTVLRV